MVPRTGSSSCGILRRIFLSSDKDLIHPLLLVFISRLLRYTDLRTILASYLRLPHAT